MALTRRTSSLVLCILFISLLQHNITSVSSRPSSVATNHETLPLTASKPDVDGFEGKARELAVVIKKGVSGGGGGGRGGGGGGGSGGRGVGGGGSLPRGGGGMIPIHNPGGAAAGSHRSSGSMSSRGTLCAIGWFAVSALAGLIMV